LLRFWVFLQVTALPTADRKVKRGGSHYGSPHALWISRRRVNPRAASHVARGGDATRHRIPNAQKSSSHHSCSCRGPSLQFL
jgi:hypothetical protein